MKRNAICLGLASLTSCSSDQSVHEYQMDAIERSIVLPKDSLPLNAYARYYTKYKEGIIIGAYTTEVEVRTADTSCLIDGRLGIRFAACPEVANASAGERRWVSLFDYPAVAGYDCTAIQIMYNEFEKKFMDVQCVEPDN